MSPLRSDLYTALREAVEGSDDDGCPGIVEEMRVPGVGPLVYIDSRTAEWKNSTGEWTVLHHWLERVPAAIDQANDLIAGDLTVAGDAALLAALGLGIPYEEWVKYQGDDLKIALPAHVRKSVDLAEKKKEYRSPRAEEMVTFLRKRAATPRWAKQFAEIILGEELNTKGPPPAQGALIYFGDGAAVALVLKVDPDGDCTVMYHDDEADTCIDVGDFGRPADTDAARFLSNISERA